MLKSLLPNSNLTGEWVDIGPLLVCNLVDVLRALFKQTINFFSSDLSFNHISGNISFLFEGACFNPYKRIYACEVPLQTLY